MDKGWIANKSRNKRERRRVKNVNEGFERLRRLVPSYVERGNRKKSRVDTLREAIFYIRALLGLLK